MEKTKAAWKAALALAASGIVIWSGTVSGSGVKPACAAETGAAPAESAAAASRAVVPYKTLSWDDFRVDDSIPGLAAETGTSLSFRYQIRVERADKNAPAGVAPYTASVSEITFSGGFDRVHSWRRSKTVAHPDARFLLQHEQGHLDIAESGRRHLESLPVSVLPAGHGQTVGDAVDDLKARMAVWFGAESARIKIRQLQYDMETEFSTNKNAQQAWNTLLTRELSQSPAQAPVLVSLSPSAPATQAR